MEGKELTSKTNKTIFFTSAMLILLVVSLSLPLSHAAPPNWSAAKIRGNGVHAEEHSSSAGTPWELYGMVCYVGSKLNVTIVWSSNNYDLYLYNYNYGNISSALSPPGPGSVNLTIT